MPRQPSLPFAQGPLTGYWLIGLRDPIPLMARNGKVGLAPALTAWWAHERGALLEIQPRTVWLEREYDAPDPDDPLAEPLLIPMANISSLQWTPLRADEKETLIHHA